MRVLAVVAHPDDESFFAGGALALHALNGDAVVIVALSDGEASRFMAPTAALQVAIDARRDSFERACVALGASGDWRPVFPDQQADTVPQITINRAVEQLVREVEPDLVYSHDPGDLNLDHRRVAESVLVATRAGARVRCMIPEWPDRCVSRTFRPQVEVALTTVALTAKLEACLCYGGELRSYPHPRSTQAIRERTVETFVEIG
jgi:LmbE family N-acetylglucosaminyl deacetylase